MRSDRFLFSRETSLSKSLDLVLNSELKSLEFHQSRIIRLRMLHFGREQRFQFLMSRIQGLQVCLKRHNLTSLVRLETPHYNTKSKGCR